MPTPRHFRAAAVTDPAAARRHAPLAPELEKRIAVVERSASSSDFDRAAWIWMALLGVAIPLLLIVLGWWA
jgi:hypothetical protein